jgi:molybdenum cofactor synthesis domain-containing protein
LNEQPRTSVLEVIAVGSEVLLGHIRDSNSAWIARQVARRGGFVRRITVVPDNVAAIAETVQGAMYGSPHAIVTHGGLGPTEDDLTLAGIAAALDVPLETSAEAERLVERRYSELRAAGLVERPGLTTERKKMAMLPCGAVPLPNLVGGAPGVHLRAGHTHLVALPGVPREMRRMFQAHVAEILELSGRSGGGYLEAWIEGTYDDSSVAAALGEVAQRHSDVYIKSRVSHFGARRPILVTFSARPGGDGGLLHAAVDDLERTLSECGLTLHIKTRQASSG